MKKLLTLISAFSFSAFQLLALDDIPKPASQAEVNAGVVPKKYVSPLTLASKLAGTNVSGILKVNGFGTNTTFQGATTFTNNGASGASLLVYGIASTNRSAIFTAANVLWFSVDGGPPMLLNSSGNLTVTGIITGDGSGLTNLNVGSSSVFVNNSYVTNSYFISGKGNSLTITNNINYGTNAHAGATNSLNMGKAYADFTATTAMAITNFSNVDATKENSSVLIVTNGSGGDLVMNLTSGVTTMDGARTCVMTNNTVTVFSFSVYGNRWTNVAYRTFY